MDAAGALRGGDHSDCADVRFARPNIQIYYTHSRPVPNGSVRGISLVRRARNKGKAQLSSALDRISERITLAFQTQKQSGGLQSQKQKFSLYFNMTGGEGVSQSPLKDKAFSTFPDRNPPFEPRPENCNFAPDHKLFRQWPVIDENAIKGLTCSNRVGRVRTRGLGHSFHRKEARRICRDCRNARSEDQRLLRAVPDAH